MKKILLSFLLAVPILGYSQSFQVNLQGQKQIGMAGAGTGVALDEAAVFFNPGAVSFLKQNGVQGGISPILMRSSFRENGSNITEHNENKVPTPFQGYAVFGSPADRLRFGMGVYTPFGGDMYWKPDWTGKYTVTSLDLRSIYFQPTLSYKITDHIGIGAGLVYSQGHVDLKRAVPLTLNNGQSSTAELEGDTHDFGWNAGIYLETEVGITIGITHRSEVNANVKSGDATFNVPAALSATFPTKFTASLPLPGTSTLGLGFHPSDKTIIDFDVNWVQWSKYKNLAFNYNTNAAIPNSVSPRNYHDAATLRLGIQNQTTAKLALRAGVGYAFSPVNDGYVTPEVPDANRVLLSAGIGYKVTNRFNIDASFLYENVKKRNETNIESGLSGEFKTVAYIPGISLSYKW
ncbi:OmpP1/FadL family transporter [Pedobacter sp. L105]|uniref:OmpP1/FadL family transporter n=1 Tax=Pedobacter sp. L105 TaxID=1641871 RepID=UPI00131A75B1|nr:outer membrane protein transport protein [Pedobacter sp. L105]